MSLDDFLKPSPLTYYLEMAKSGVYKADLSREQAAVILKSYDYGIKALDDAEIEILDQVMSILKDEIWP